MIYLFVFVSFCVKIISFININFFVAYGCPKIIPRSPLKSKKFNDGRVIDLSCDLGYYLNANISTTTIDSNELNAVTSFPFQNLRLYCVGKTWIMDDPRTDISSFVVGRVPISGLPSCEGKYFTFLNCLLTVLSFQFTKHLLQLQ